MTIRGDSAEYDILYDACKSLEDDDLFTIEIGVREGMSSQVILDALSEKKHWHLGIDPYGNIEYKHFDDPNTVWNGVPIPPRYSNQMKATLLKDLSGYENFSLLQLEDEEYMKRFHDGFPIYRNKKELRTVYDLVFFDGPHTTYANLKEAIFFAERSRNGTVFVFDDYPRYDMNDILKVIVNEFGFNLLKQGKTKLALKKV